MSDDNTATATDGATTVRRSVEVKDAGIIVRLEVNTSADGVTSVRVTDDLPARVDPNEVGFHPDHAPEDGTAGADGVVFAGEVTADQPLVVAYGAYFDTTTLEGGVPDAALRLDATTQVPEPESSSGGLFGFIGRLFGRSDDEEPDGPADRAGGTPETGSFEQLDEQESTEAAEDVETSEEDAEATESEPATADDTEESDAEPVSEVTATESADSAEPDDKSADEDDKKPAEPAITEAEEPATAATDGLGDEVTVEQEGIEPESAVTEVDPDSEPSPAVTRVAEDNSAEEEPADAVPDDMEPDDPEVDDAEAESAESVSEEPVDEESESEDADLVEVESDESTDEDTPDAESDDEPVAANTEDTAADNGPARLPEGSVAAALAAELEAGEVDERTREKLVEELEVALTGSQVARLDRVQKRTDDLRAYVEPLKDLLDEEGRPTEVIADLREDIRAVRGDVRQVRQEVTDVGDDVERVSEEVREEVSAELSALSDELSALESAVEEGAAERTDLDERLDAATADIERAREELAADVSAVREDLTAELERVERQAREGRRDITADVEELRAVAAQVESLREALSSAFDIGGSDIETPSADAVDAGQTDTSADADDAAAADADEDVLEEGADSADIESSIREVETDEDEEEPSFEL
ncbi:hypothetical protein [Halosegnis sp.]|uniref:hypothetical protein n=1 Tax=Halosegnis sp. TaxID=2864959 RepID=UPI0035D4EC0B